MLNEICVNDENCLYTKRISCWEFRNNSHTGATTPQRRRGTHVLIHEDENFENLRIILRFMFWIIETN